MFPSRQDTTDTLWAIFNNNLHILSLSYKQEGIIEYSFSFVESKNMVVIVATRLGFPSYLEWISIA